MWYTRRFRIDDGSWVITSRDGVALEQVQKMLVLIHVFIQARDNNSRGEPTTLPETLKALIDARHVGTGGFSNVYAIDASHVFKSVRASRLHKARNRHQGLCGLLVPAHRNLVKSCFAISFEHSAGWCAHGVVERLVLGRSLHEHLRDAPAQLALGPLLRGIVEAIRALHSHDIIHGDIKPQNVLVSSPTHGMLTDFGLCRFDKSLLVGPLKHPRATSTWATAGTKAYQPCWIKRMEARANERMADESIRRGNKSLDAYAMMCVWLFAHAAVGLRRQELRDEADCRATRSIGTWSRVTTRNARELLRLAREAPRDVPPALWEAIERGAPLARAFASVWDALDANGCPIPERLQSAEAILAPA